MYQRIMVIQDPAFNIVEANPAVSDYFFNFIYAMAGLYLVYFFALLVLNYRAFGTMRPANRFVLIITVFTLIVVFVGIFLNLNTALRSEAALIMVAYGACNLYVWLLTFAMVPGERSPMWVREMLNRGGNRESSRFQEEELGEIDTKGVLGGNDDEFDETNRQRVDDEEEIAEEEVEEEEEYHNNTHESEITEEFEARAQKAATDAAEKRKRSVQASRVSVPQTAPVHQQQPGRGRNSGRKPIPDIVIDVNEEDEEEEEEEEEEEARKVKEATQKTRQPRPAPVAVPISVSPKTAKINFAAAAAAAQKPVVRKQ